MKHIILVLFFLLTYIAAKSQSQQQREIISNYIIAHNIGTTESIKHFIEQNYTPTFLNKIDIGSHIKFYKNIIEEFGDLNLDIYKTTEQSTNQVTVYLTKESISVFANYLKPTEILVLKLNQDANNLKLMDKGLGLGSLLCELKK